MGLRAEVDVDRLPGNDVPMIDVPASAAPVPHKKIPLPDVRRLDCYDNLL